MAGSNQNRHAELRHRRSVPKSLTRRGALTCPFICMKFNGFVSHYRPTSTSMVWISGGGYVLDFCLGVCRIPGRTVFGRAIEGIEIDA